MRRSGPRRLLACLCCLCWRPAAAAARKLSALAKSDFNGCSGSSGGFVAQPEGAPPPWNGDMEAFFDDYRPIADVDAFVAKLRAAFPDLVTVKDIGRSWEGRPLRVLEVANQSQAADGAAEPVPLQDRPCIFLQAAQHAREWIAPAALLFALRDLLQRASSPASGAGGAGEAEAADAARQMLARYVLAVVPVANPDGYAYSWTTNRMWRKTRSSRTSCNGGEVGGVDPNRNWDYKWRETDNAQYASDLRNPCTQVYAGPAPFSEPEVSSIAMYLRARHDRSAMLSWVDPATGGVHVGPGHVAAFVDYHSYAQMLLPPWGYTDTLPEAPDEAYQTGLTDALVAGFRAVSGRTFQAGPNLFPPDPGTAPDWSYGELGVRASLTVELEGTFYDSTGFCLPHGEIRSVGEEQSAGLLALVAYLRAQGDEPSSLIGTHRPELLSTLAPTPAPAPAPTPGAHVTTTDAARRPALGAAGCWWLLTLGVMLPWRS